MKKASYNLRADVWSLGFVLWEIFTLNSLGEMLPGARAPYPGWTPPVPLDLPLLARMLLEKMWERDPAKRPPAKEVVQALRRLLGYAELQLLGRG